MTSLSFRPFIPRAIASAVLGTGIGLSATLAIATVALGADESVQGNAARPPIAPSSEVLVTQPAQISTDELLGSQRDGIDISEEPTLIFVLEDSVISPREQIEENKPANSNAIHFPLGN
ncbi:MAG: hypothetical protein ACFB5Z_18245 [Elainellaceae cyanobacterium]